MIGMAAAEPYLNKSLPYAAGLSAIAPRPAEALDINPASPAFDTAASRSAPTSVAYLAICSCVAPSASVGKLPANCCAPMSAAAKPPVPAPIKLSPKPAPPYAPNPAMRPRDRLPVAKVVRPPTVKPAIPADIMPPPKAKPAGPKNAPRAIGATALNKSDSMPASGKPVSGLMVKERPFAWAKACKRWTSSGVMWISKESSPRPLLATSWANLCRLIFASQNGGWSIISC